ncbi:protein of unknown function [Candidatus Nitrotoga arctica]|uniref:Uncharacterized protein n=1 Tax=Candidatus Nitrotoga arctica TaxID=453162 RepID=A0ABN8ANZ9_9PROT|nr:protein of unknown function [Candidatus Nitrotoga arctica]
MLLMLIVQGNQSVTAISINPSAKTVTNIVPISIDFPQALFPTTGVSKLFLLGNIFNTPNLCDVVNYSCFNF